MVETIPNLTYGTVTGRFLAAVADSDADLDKNPDGVPLTGTVKFTPSVSALLLTASTPPMTVLPAVIVATLDAQGYVSLNGERGVNLIATDTMDTSPTAFTYEVSFQNIRYAGGPNLPYPSFSIEVPANTVVDLTLTSPVPSSGGVPVVRDENAVWTAANSATQAAAAAAQSVTDARSVLAQMANGTFTGVGLVVRTGVPQVLKPSDYNVIQFNTVDLDSVNKFDTATGLYTIPISGMWNVTGTLRTADGALPVGANIGLGIGPQNGDYPGFIWTSAGAFRNTFDVARTVYFAAGDKIRLYTYYEAGNDVNTTSATMSLNLITAAADVPGGSYTKPETGIPASDLDPTIQSRLLSLDSLNYRFGSPVTDLGSTDLNNLGVTGFYRGYGLINAPLGNSWFYFEVLRHDDSFILQRATGLNSPNTNRVYVRTRDATVWTTWVLVSDASGAVDTGARAALTALNDRLGVVAKDIGAADLNNIQDNGWYNGQSMTNAPLGSSEWFFVEVVGYTNDAGAYRMQTATAFTNPSGGGVVNRQWRRTKLAGAWLPWVEVRSNAITTVNGVAPDTNGNLVLAAGGSTGDAAPVTSDTSAALLTVPNGSATLRRVLTGTAGVVLPASPSAATSYTVQLILKQDAVGNRVIDWPQAIYWPGGNKPTLSTTPNAIDHVRLMWTGSEWLGYPQGSAFSMAPIAPKTVYSDTFTAADSSFPKPAWVATPSGVGIIGNRMVVSPEPIAWSGTNYVILGTPDNTNGSVATGAPAVVADFEAVFDWSLVSLAEQYPKIGIRVRPRTYQGQPDDLWLDGDGAGMFKTGYTIVFSPTAGIIEVVDGTTTGALDSKSGIVFPSKDMTMRIKVSGKGLYIRLWTKGAAEPTTWTYSNATVLYTEPGGTIGFTAANNGDAISKAVYIDNFVMTTPVIVPGPSMNAPAVDPTGWTRIFTEDFNTAAPVGTGPTGFITQYANSFQPYNDEGSYFPRAMISSHDGYMDVYMDGTRGSAGTFGTPTNAFNRVGGRFTMRAMAIDGIGNGTAVIIWPTSEVWAQGELDYPEGNFEDSPMVHHHSMTVGSEASAQDALTGVSWRDWHVYSVEWIPGTSVKYFVDEVLIYTATTDVPTTPHRFMFQVGNYGNPGHLLIDWVTISDKK